MTIRPVADDWKLTYEKVEPHGLCCDNCKARRVLLADAMDALAAVADQELGASFDSRATRRHEARELLARYAALDARAGETT